MTGRTPVILEGDITILRAGEDSDSIRSQILQACSLQGFGLTLHGLGVVKAH